MMFDSGIAALARSVMYEGYLLYPYRPSLKNRQRWAFGDVLPQTWCDSNATGDHGHIQIECLIDGNDSTTVRVVLRFLQLKASLEGFDKNKQGVLEREVESSCVCLGSIAKTPLEAGFSFPTSELLPAKQIEGPPIFDASADSEWICGSIMVEAEPLTEIAFKLKVVVEVQRNDQNTAAGRPWLGAWVRPNSFCEYMTVSLFR